MPSSKKQEAVNKIFNAMSGDPCKMRDFLLCSDEIKMDFRDYLEEFLVGYKHPARPAYAWNNKNNLNRADIACRAGLWLDEKRFFKTNEVHFRPKESFRDLDEKNNAKNNP